MLACKAARFADQYSGQSLLKVPSRSGWLGSTGKGARSSALIQGRTNVIPGGVSGSSDFLPRLPQSSQRRLAPTSRKQSISGVPVSFYRKCIIAQICAHLGRLSRQVAAAEPHVTFSYKSSTSTALLRVLRTSQAQNDSIHRVVSCKS